MVLLAPGHLTLHSKQPHHNTMTLNLHSSVSSPLITEHVGYSAILSVTLIPVHEESIRLAGFDWCAPVFMVAHSSRCPGIDLVYILHLNDRSWAWSRG
jgi:hypothetical protein